LDVTGTWFTGGTSTTTKPQVLIEPAGTTSTAWSTSGTGLGVNAASGFSGNLLDLQVNGTPLTSVTSAGRLLLNSSGPSATTYALRIGGAAGEAFSYSLGRNSDNGLFHFYGAQTGSNGYVFGGINGERARIDSSGRLLVGTSAARTNFWNGSINSAALQIEGTDYAGASLSLIDNNTADGDAGALIIAKSGGSSVGSNTLVANGEALGGVVFQGNDGTEFVPAAFISAVVDGTPGANDMPGRLVFSTTADGASSSTERMRITSAGHILVGQATGDFNTVGNSLFANGTAQFVSSGQTTVNINRKASDGTAVQFYRDANTPGSISVTTTATTYATSSDYRLKENVVPLTGAIDRVNDLPVHRFNFIADPDKTVDGFIAHEAQAIVPECVTGEKDAVDDDGNPVYQGIDQSKLVPLLTAALQEAIGEIESLKARVAALEGA
jgi:hypothetical protein